MKPLISIYHGFYRTKTQNIIIVCNEYNLLYNEKPIWTKPIFNRNPINLHDYYITKAYLKNQPYYFTKALQNLRKHRDIATNINLQLHVKLLSFLIGESNIDFAYLIDKSILTDPGFVKTTDVNSKIIVVCPGYNLCFTENIWGEIVYGESANSTDS